MEIEELRKIRNLVLGNKRRKEWLLNSGEILKNVVKCMEFQNRRKFAIVIVVSLMKMGKETTERLQSEFRLLEIFISLLRDHQEVLEDVLHALTVYFGYPEMSTKIVMEKDFILRMEKILMDIRFNEKIKGLVMGLIGLLVEQQPLENSSLISDWCPQFPHICCKSILSKDPWMAEFGASALSSLVLQNCTLALFVSAQDLLKEHLLTMVINRSHEEFRVPILKLLSRTSKYVTNYISENSMQEVVIPTVIEVLNDPNQSVQVEAPQILAHLIQNNPSLKCSQVAIQAISTLATALKNESSSIELKKNVLFALGLICCQEEEYRTIVQQRDNMPVIIELLDSSDEGLCAAACYCIKGMSQSSKRFRQALVEMNVFSKLMTLFTERFTSVRILNYALEAISVLLIDFDTCKQMLLTSQKELLSIIDLTRRNDKLKMNAISVLKNFAFTTTNEAVTSLLEMFPLNSMLELLKSTEVEVQAAAMNLIRNVCNSLVNLSSNIDVKEITEAIVPYLRNGHWKLKVQILYTLCSLVKQNYVISDGIITIILNYCFIQGENTELLEAVFWFLTSYVRTKEIPNPRLRNLQLIYPTLLNQVETYLSSDQGILKERADNFLSLIKDRPSMGTQG